MRVLVTGSRHWEDRRTVEHALRHFLAAPGDCILVHGDARGLDRMAAEEAVAMGCRVEAHPADWSQGKQAGPARNQRMVDLGADLVLAFPMPDSRGTWDCVRRAHAAQILVWVVSAKGASRYRPDH